MTDIVERLRGEILDAVSRLVAGAFQRDGEVLPENKRPRFTIPSDPIRDSDLIAAAGVQEAAAEIERLWERCYPSKVVIFGCTGHYVSEKVAAEIERLRLKITSIEAEMGAQDEFIEKQEASIERLLANTAKLLEALRPRLSVNARDLILDEIEAEEAVGDPKVADAIRCLLEWNDRAARVIKEVEGK